MNASTHGGMKPSTTRVLPPILAGLALLAALIATAVTAAAPVFTDWSAPVSLGPPVNSGAAESGPALSEDGLSLYFHSNRPGGLGGFDLWVSQRPTPDAAWGEPVNLGATTNTIAADSVPALSRDGHWLFFSSDRAGGFGGNDIWTSWRADVGDDLGWEPPVNLGPNVNTALTDFGAAYLAVEGARPQLFFGRGGADRDLYVSELGTDGSWGAATLIPELSSPLVETKPTLRADGLEIVFHREVAPSPATTDLWSATRPNLDAPWSEPVNLAAPVNTTSTEAHPLLLADGRALYFGSNRVGSLGSTDIFVTTREQILPATKDDCKHGGWEQFGVFGNQGDCVSWLAAGGRNQPGG